MFRSFGSSVWQFILHPLFYQMTIQKTLTCQNGSPRGVLLLLKICIFLVYFFSKEHFLEVC